MFFIPFIRFSYTTENFGKAISDYATVLLNEVMNKNDAFVAEEDGERFTSIYINTFQKSAGSIYTAKRHANTLAEALPVLKDKINICDLIIITGIKVFYPKLYQLIQTAGPLLTGSASPSAYDEHKRHIQELAAKLDAIIKWYDEQSGNGRYIRGMLILLFPNLNVAYKNIQQTNEQYLDCVGKRRICSAEHFALYFSVQYETR